MQFWKEDENIFKMMYYNMHEKKFCHCSLTPQHRWYTRGGGGQARGSNSGMRKVYLWDHHLSSFHSPSTYRALLVLALVQRSSCLEWAKLARRDLGTEGLSTWQRSGRWLAPLGFYRAKSWWRVTHFTAKIVSFKYLISRVGHTCGGW